MLLMRLCSHRLAPPHGLHVLLGGVVMVVLADARPTALLAPVSLAMFADARPTTLLELASFTVLLSDFKPPD